MRVVKSLVNLPRTHVTDILSATYTDIVLVKIEEEKGKQDKLKKIDVILRALELMLDAAKTLISLFK